MEKEYFGTYAQFQKENSLDTKVKFKGVKSRYANFNFTVVEFTAFISAVYCNILKKVPYSILLYKLVWHFQKIQIWNAFNSQNIKYDFIILISEHILPIHFFCKVTKFELLFIQKLISRNSESDNNITFY